PGPAATPLLRAFRPPPPARPGSPARAAHPRPAAHALPAAVAAAAVRRPVHGAAMGLRRRARLLPPGVLATVHPPHPGAGADPDGARPPVHPPRPLPRTHAPPPPPHPP